VTITHALALLAGVLAAIGMHNHGEGGWWAPALFAAGLLLYAVRALRPLASCCAGFLWAWWPMQQYDQSRLGVDFDERALVVAQIEGLPLRRGDEVFFTALLQPERPVRLPEPPWRAQLRWPAAPAVNAGERWQLLVALRAPPDAINPGSAAFALQPLRLRIHGAGHVLSSVLNRRLAPAPASLTGLRERIARAIAARVAERDAAALIIALAIGDTQRVSVEQWRVFNATGITHLVAISGLHVTLFCLLVAWSGGHLWRYCPWLQRRSARHSFAALAGLIASCGYALLAGWSVPTQRTLLMLASWHGLRIAARPRTASRTLAFGLIGVLLLDPLAPLAAGFWLSFLAVGALLLQGAITPAPLPAWRALLYTQAQVAAALLPVSVAVFASISLAGLAVNLIAIPLFSLLLVPLILAAVVALGVWPALGGLLLKGAVLVISGFWPLLHAVAASPAALLQASAPRWWYLLAAPAVAVALLPWRPWMRGTAALALLPLAIPAATEPAPGSFAATVFDLGRGQAVLLRTAHHALLFDDGETWESAGSASAARLVPALRYYRIRHLDVLMLPHLDADHGAGVAAIAAAVPVPTLRVGAMRNLPPEFVPCRNGERWRWDGVDFELLDGSACALRISAGRNALLLPGAAAARAQILQLALHLSPTAVVLIPGQGRAAARQTELIQAAAPRLAILAADARAARTASVAASVAAWRAAGAGIHITGVDGALELQFRPDGPISLLRWCKP
jgi:competence protein ComEC